MSDIKRLWSFTSWAQERVRGSWRLNQTAAHLALSAISLLFIIALTSTLPTLEAIAQSRTWYYMPTGNGHGFQVFDRREGKITYFLEHPYRYVSPSDTDIPSGRTVPGVGRRDLAHDLYFGVNVGGQTRWLNDIRESVRYEAESNIIQASTRVGTVLLDTYYYAPFGLEANASVMLVRARATEETSLSFFSKTNLKFGLGGGRTDPSDENETLSWSAEEGYAIETGPGGGHAIYLPIGGVDQAGCGVDRSIYNSVLQQGTLGAVNSCSGDHIVFAAQRDYTLSANEEVWWGGVVLFVNDTPNHPQAEVFKDTRDVQTLIDQWRTFLGDRDAKELHQQALDEWEAWRVDSAPEELSEVELKIWRQSEAVLRMGQVREPTQSNRYNYGMYLASLPVGEWHTGWVRDGVYAIVAMAMIGHFEEAQMGVEFFLNAERGVFSELGDQYRVSSCRYFGNGMEEADGNQAGPNLETDGWGLTLWGASMYLQYSCDLDWLDRPTSYGDTVFEALYQIAQDIENMIEPSTGLPKGDCSIWEVHWDLRQTFTYTAATQIRGLYDFAQIAYIAGREDLASKYWALAERMHTATLDLLVYTPLNSLASHRGVANSEIHVDGSTVEMLSWGLVDIDDPIFAGTLSQYDRLKTGFGGYRRLETRLSLTGESGANEYDLSEWVLLDLRIGSMWRELGNFELADTLLNKVTDLATVNDNLIAELYEPNTGDYAGVVPMVGYGAGAWQMTQLHKYGSPPPSFGIGFESCFNDPTSGGAETSPTGGAEMSSGASSMLGGEEARQEMSDSSSGTSGGQMSSPGRFNGESAGVAGTDRSGPGLSGDSRSVDGYNWDADSDASLCSSSSGGLHLWWLGLLFGLGSFRRIRWV